MSSPEISEITEFVDKPRLSVGQHVWSVGNEDNPVVREGKILAIGEHLAVLELVTARGRKKPFFLGRCFSTQHDAVYAALVIRDAEISRLTSDLAATMAQIQHLRTMRFTGPVIA